MPRAARASLRVAPLAVERVRLALAAARCAPDTGLVRLDYSLTVCTDAEPNRLRRSVDALEGDERARGLECSQRSRLGSV